LKPALFKVDLHVNFYGPLIRNSLMKNISRILISTILLFFSVKAGIVSAANGIVPLPQSRETFVYSAAAYPLESSDPSRSKPIGIGPLAQGGDIFSLQIIAGPFAQPVDMYLTMLSPDDKRGPVLSLTTGNTFEPLLDSSKPWRKRVTGVSEVIMHIPVSTMASGPYVLMFAVMPADVQDRYYLWTVPFLVP